ncbi:MAG: hypothetical protein IPG66_08225 [Hydrogenophilales bacterium]|nr:hypothetical protein [Hydrogenophilales bacterium]
MNTTFDFRIDTWKPDTLPMARLAEYLARLAVLFGNKEHVHFMKVRKGSAIPEIVVDEPAVPKVKARLSLVNTPDVPEDISRANRDINRMLRDDNACGVLRLKAGANILEFPGRKTPLAEEAVVYEVGELDGVVIRIGGKDETVPVLVESERGIYYHCNASRENARKLAAFLFGQTVRVVGRGKWRRTQEGEWELENFDIKDFEVLDETPLADVVAGLRVLEGSGWNEMDDPQAELKCLRGA